MFDDVLEDAHVELIDDLLSDAPCSGTSTCAQGGSCKAKKKNGKYCLTADECGSGACADNKCKQANGTQCWTDADCCSGACDSHVCVGLAGDTLCDGNPYN